MDKDSFKVPPGFVNSNHAKHDQPKNNSNNISMNSPASTAPSTSPSPSPSPSPQTRRIINKIPLDFSKLKQAGLDRKLAEALSKQQNSSLSKKIASATTKSPSLVSASVAAPAAAAASPATQQQRERSTAGLSGRKRQSPNLVAVDEQSLHIKAMIKNKILSKMTKNQETNQEATTTTTATSQEVNTTPTRSFPTPIAKADVTARPKLLLNLVNQLPKHRAMCGVSRPAARQQPTAATSQATAATSPAILSPSPFQPPSTLQSKPQQPETPPVVPSKPLIVLENKVLAPNEKIDINELRLSKGASIALPPKIITVPELKPEKVKSAPRILQLPGSSAKKVILNANKLKMSREQISQLAKQISKQAEQHPVTKPKADATPTPSVVERISATELQTSLITPLPVVVEATPAAPIAAATPKSSLKSSTSAATTSSSLSAVDFIAQLKATCSVNYMNLSAEEMSMNALFMGCDTPNSATATPEPSFLTTPKPTFIPTPAATPETTSAPIFPSNPAATLLAIPALPIPVVPSTPVASSSTSTTISVECNADEELPIGKILQMDDMDILHATMNVNENEPNVLCISPNAIKMQKSRQSIEEPPVENETAALSLESQVSLVSAEVSTEASAEPSTKEVTTTLVEPKKVEEVPIKPVDQVEKKEEKPATTTRQPFRSKKGKINLVQRNKRASVGKANNIKDNAKKVEDKTAAMNGKEEENKLSHLNLPEEMEVDEQIVGKQNICAETNEEIAQQKSKNKMDNATESKAIVKTNEEANESQVIVNNVVKVSEQKSAEVAEDQSTKNKLETTPEIRTNSEVLESEEKLVEKEKNIKEQIMIKRNATIEIRESEEETKTTIESKESAEETTDDKTPISPKKNVDIELQNSSETTEETQVVETPLNASIKMNLSQLYHPPKMPKSKQKINEKEVTLNEEVPTSSVSLREILSQEEPQPQGEAQLPFRQDVNKSKPDEKAPTEGKGIQNLLQHLAAENVMPISKETKDIKETKTEEPAKAPRKKLLKTRPILNAKRASKAVPSKPEAVHPRKKALLVENKVNGVAHRTSSTSDDDSGMFHGFPDETPSTKCVVSLRSTGTDISDDATPDYDETEEDPQPEDEKVAKKPKTDPAPAEKQLETIPEQIDKEKAEEIPEQIDKEEKQKRIEQIDRETIPDRIDKDTNGTITEQNNEEKVIQKQNDENKQKATEELDKEAVEAITETESEAIPESSEDEKLKVTRKLIDKKKPKETKEPAKEEVEAATKTNDEEKLEETTKPIEEEKLKQPTKPTKNNKRKSVKNQLNTEAIETIKQPIEQPQQRPEEKTTEEIDEEIPQTIPETVSEKLDTNSEADKQKPKAVTKSSKKKNQRKSEVKDNPEMDQVEKVSEAEPEKSKDNPDKTDKEKQTKEETKAESISVPANGKLKVIRKSINKEQPKKILEQLDKDQEEKPSSTAEKESDSVETPIEKKKRGGRPRKVTPIAVEANAEPIETTQTKTEEVEVVIPATGKRRQQSRDARKSTDSTEDATPLAKRARRGRLSKVSPLSTTTELDTPAKPGRKSKIVAATPAATTTDGELETPEPKKRRGRPCKVEPAVCTDTENTDADFPTNLGTALFTSTPESGPKKRGRKPKYHDLLSLTKKLKSGASAENDEETLRQSFKFEGPDYWPKSVDINLRLFLIRNREQLNSDEELREEGRGTGAVQCGLCFVRCEKMQWKSHIAEHYGVGWPTDAVPVFVTRNILLSQMVIYSKAGHRVTCRLCARTFGSGLGMLLHLENCGNAIERVKCEWCNHLYATTFLNSHYKQCNKRLEAVEPPEPATDTTADESTTVFSNAGRTKRKSTIKAETKLQKMAAQLKAEQKSNQEDFENDSSDYDMNVDKESSVEYESEGVDSNEENDQAFSGEDDDEEPNKRKKSRANRTATSTSTPTDKILKSEGDLAVRWKHFVSKNYSTVALYANLLPYYEQLPADEASKLLPSRESSSMRYAYGHKVNDDWRQLAPLEGFNCKDEYICHLGKPIKQLAWVPLPSSVETQYLLCSQRTKMLGFTRQFKDKQEDALLLLLECKASPSGKRKEWPFEMRLHYGIRFQGTVNSFQFMPSGGYDESTNRLGLLAVASATGVVIYALPLQLTKSKTVEQDENAVIVLEAGLILSLDIDSPTINDPCTKICWSQASGHKLLVTGYASGNVAFWNIDDVDGLNCIEQNNQRHLLPAHFFYFGERNIQILELHYDTNGARWLVVGTNVRKYWVYDIANWSQPLSILGDMICNLFLSSVTWSPLWNSLIIGCSQLTRLQFSRLIIINPVESMPCRHMTVEVMLNTIRDVHFNYDQDVIASIADNGDAAFIKANEFAAESVLRKRKKKHPLITTETNYLGDEEEPKHVSPEVFQRDYGLLIRPIRHGLDKEKATSYNDPKREPSFGMRNMIRLNSVRWNWNPSAKGWVAIGAEHGLLRIINYETGDGS